VDQGTVWFDMGNSIRCGARINVDGTYDNGSFSITQVNGGSPAINAAYCSGLAGVWSYVVTTEGYRFDYGGTIYEWKSY
jgi:hypothetical protein